MASCDVTVVYREPLPHGKLLVLQPCAGGGSTLALPARTRLSVPDDAEWAPPGAVLRLTLEPVPITSEVPDAECVD